MNTALIRAEEVLEKNKILTAPVDVEKIMQIEGLDLEEWQFEGRIKEVYLGDCIGVKKGLPSCERRELVAHALGHHFLGVGNHCYFAIHNYLTLKKQERTAQCFAAYILVPEKLLAKAKDMEIYELAEHFKVSEDFMKFRLELNGLNQK